MNKTTALSTVLALALAAVGAARAQEDPVHNVIDACKPDIDSYCSQVSPGEGRLLACFYAHQDKLSGRCGWALYQGAAQIERQLEQFAAAVTHLANQCRDDLLKHCGEVPMGEGRVASCLLDHQDEVSEGCSQAIDDVGLERVEG